MAVETRRSEPRFEAVGKRSAGFGILVITRTFFLCMGWLICIPRGLLSSQIDYFSS